MSQKRGFSQRVDANQAEIVKALRKAGVYVSIAGQPFDLLCVPASEGKFIWLEVKDGSKSASAQQLTPAQIKTLMELRNRAPVYVVRTVDEALAAVGVNREQGVPVATSGTPDNGLSTIFSGCGSRGRSVAANVRGGADADASEGGGL